MVKNIKVQLQTAFIVTSLLAALCLMLAASFTRYKIVLSKSVSATQSSVRNFKSGNLVSAIYFGRKSVKYCPDEFWGHLNLGMALSENGEHTEAISELQTANKIMETNEANLYLAKSLTAAGNLSEAAHFFDKAAQGNDPQIAMEARHLHIHPKQK